MFKGFHIMVSFPKKTEVTYFIESSICGLELSGKEAGPHRRD
jgi:hypothetical protein